VPTAVLQVHLEALPSELAVDGRYSRALVVVRRRNRPVARIDAPVVGGRIDMTSFRERLSSGVQRHVRSWLLEDYLGPDPRSPIADATVAICTRERPDDLSRALRAVQALDPAPCEILIVDNNPASERTRMLVKTFASVKYVCEPRRGLDAARNRALREARHGIVAFSDDDAAPEPSWLGALLAPFSEPQVWCTTGLTLPLELETPAQEWFERYTPFSRGFARRVFDGIRDDPAAVGAIGAGANMAVRRAVLDQFGGFDEALDAGTPACSGGDHDMFGRILAAGYRIVYEPAAVSWHRHRRTWPELRDAVRGYGAGVYAMWTRRLLIDGEVGVLRQAFRWLRHGQLPTLVRALRGRPDAVPLDLIRAELAGCVAGPGAYFKSRRQLARSRNHQ
jgi:GT2 family glycosyltransferase